MSGNKPVFIAITAVIVVLVLSVGVTAALNFNSLSSAFKPASTPVSVPVSSSAIKSSSSSSSKASSSTGASSKSNGAASSSANKLKVLAYVNGEPLYDVYIKDFKCNLPKSPDSDLYNLFVRFIVLSQEAKKENLTVDEKDIISSMNKIMNYSKQKDAKLQAAEKKVYDLHNKYAKACGVSFSDYINKVFIPIDKYEKLSEALNSKFLGKYKTSDAKKAEKDWNTYTDGLVKKAVIKKVA